VRQTEQTLLEQMRITDLELESRMALFGLTERDTTALRNVRPLMESRIAGIVDRFYELQTSVPDIALLIGDADTLRRLRSAQRRYLQGLFSGQYNLEYVNNRLRIGLVHKRIGVEPKLYLAAVDTLKSLTVEDLREVLPDDEVFDMTANALRKLIMFDIALVFETYIRSLVAEIETSKDRSEQYARSLEEKVRERTLQLEQMARVDALTGLSNARTLQDSLTDALSRAMSREEPLALVYLDVDRFKQVNDSEGHHRGDEVLKIVAEAIRAACRSEDECFRHGGDEFCIVLPNCTADEARRTIIPRVHEMLVRSGQDITVSAGCAETGPPDYASVETLIRWADREMYAHKHATRSVNGAPLSDTLLDGVGHTSP
jgi:diguanylate cyclase (GGDEF)-like protein